MRWVIVTTGLLSVGVAAPDASANGGPDMPATPVPQFSEAEAPGVSLWPIDPGTGEIRLRPAGVAVGTTRDQLTPLPDRRDSTDYITQSVAGVQCGHELYMDVAVPGQHDENAPAAGWLAVVYNAGLQVWDLGDPELGSSPAASADGWCGIYGPCEWDTFANFGEDDFYVYGVDVVDVGGTLYIGVAAVSGVGFTAWTFDTATSTLRQVYQDAEGSSSDVSVVADPSGTVYAFAANAGSAGGDGVRVYDLTAAAALPPKADVCVDDANPSCGVFAGSIGTAGLNFVSAHVSGDRIYVATSPGAIANALVGLQIWEVGDPADPSASMLRYDAEPSRIDAPTLFHYAGTEYLALVDKSAGPSRPGQMHVYDIGACLDADGCEDLGTPLATENLLYSAAGRHFLDLSFSEGVPMLHYGMETTGLFGSGFERVWELSELPRAHGVDGLPELTDDGGTYPDPCSGEPVDYFGDYYVANDYGLNRFNPRHGVFAGAHLYRAATTVLDAHVRTLDTCGDAIVQPDEDCDDPTDPGCVDCMSMGTSGTSGGADSSGGGGGSGDGSDATAGSGVGTSAGPGDGTEGPAADGDGGGEGGGCGCSAPASPRPVAWWTLAGLGLWGLTRRRDKDRDKSRRGTKRTPGGGSSLRHRGERA